ncbi:rRNA-processing protein Efg1 [Arabidopsis thaliana x Arabidopsis arenosa]|uniref:rRNA-processing protein EFG1 n=1 Tax=Arabidopsis thaliana x Arabidopsis arenosa TaxID=1240361 RepID=A0A8T2C6I2_9BRAS|nr:rRNA-processing protein Efg1 [Arabidopsis thaliana x Arabidopsis arenosa]
MAHGGYAKRRVAERKTTAGSSRRSKGLRVERKPKNSSLKNQIRSIGRMIRKDLPPEVRAALEKKLDDLKKQQDIHICLAVERKIFLRNRKVRFFERRKIERSIRRLEKLQRSTSGGHVQDAEIGGQLNKLKEDLEYVRFFPKNEKYVSLFSGGDDLHVSERRSKLRKQIKANIIVAAASGKELEETGSEDDALLDLSDDDFFVNGSSSDEADADDEWTDKSTKEPVSSAFGRATSSMSSDERNQKPYTTRVLMPPPRSRFASTSRQYSSVKRNEIPSSSNTSHRRSQSSHAATSSHTSQSSNLSSNSDAHKPKRKRRPKKRKQQA